MGGNVVSALVALAMQQSNDGVARVAILPIAVFWFLDGFYLSRERQFRRLYNHVAAVGENVVNFSMDSSEFRKPWTDIPFALFSRAVWPCYFLAILAVFVAAHAVRHPKRTLCQFSMHQRYLVWENNK